MSIKRIVDIAEVRSGCSAKGLAVVFVDDTAFLGRASALMALEAKVVALTQRVNRGEEHERIVTTRRWVKSLMAVGTVSY